MQIVMSGEQVDTLVRLLGAGQGAMEYSLEHDDLGSEKGVVRTSVVNMIEEYKKMISMIVEQHNAQVRV